MSVLPVPGPVQVSLARFKSVLPGRPRATHSQVRSAMRWLAASLHGRQASVVPDTQKGTPTRVLRSPPYTARKRRKVTARETFKRGSNCQVNILSKCTECVLEDRDDSLVGSERETCNGTTLKTSQNWWHLEQSTAVTSNGTRCVPIACTFSDTLLCRVYMIHKYAPTNIHLNIPITPLPVLFLKGCQVGMRPAYLNMMQVANLASYKLLTMSGGSVSCKPSPCHSNLAEDR